jgi:hypothetical protein
LHPITNEFSTILQAKKLFHKFIVDVWGNNKTSSVALGKNELNNIEQH